jgi:glycosyltransferase involved in cell wall biosynthesis
MPKVKVGLVHTTIGPYRHPLFEKLTKEVDLMVYYCSVKHGSREWDLWPRNYDYKYKILPRIPLKTSIGDQSLNLSIIKELVLNKPHILVLSDYTEPTTWLALAVAKLLKIPLIYWTEGIREPQSILGKISRPLRTLFIKKSASIIVPGRVSKNYVISLGADPEKVFIAPNALDNELFIKISEEFMPRKDELKRQLGFEDKVIVLCVGQLIERKGIKYLLHAYAKIQREYANVALLVLGSGPLESNLRKLADSLELLGFRIIGSGLSLRKLVTLYSVADIFVLPTLEDVWGFVINEAMACGLPVVATHASQAALEMISSGNNGYVIKEGDSEELHVALENLIRNPAERERMGSRSKEIATNRFAVSHMVEGFLSAIKYCTNTKMISTNGHWLATGCSMRRQNRPNV